jgi:hypothetical protein
MWEAPTEMTKFILNKGAELQRCSAKQPLFSSIAPVTPFFCNPFYLQSVLVHSANCVENMYTVACRRVLSSAPLLVIGSKPLVAFGNKTYKLNLKTRITNKTITLGIW